MIHRNKNLPRLHNKREHAMSARWMSVQWRSATRWRSPQAAQCLGFQRWHLSKDAHPQKNPQLPACHKMSETTNQKNYILAKAFWAFGLVDLWHGFMVSIMDLKFLQNGQDEKLQMTQKSSSTSPWSPYYNPLTAPPELRARSLQPQRLFHHSSLYRRDVPSDQSPHPKHPKSFPSASPWLTRRWGITGCKSKEDPRAIFFYIICSDMFSVLMSFLKNCKSLWFNTNTFEST